MDKEISYTFSSPNGTLFTISTSETATTVHTIGGDYTGYAVTGITGTFGGQTITGLVGSGGAQQNGPTGTYDNTIFTADNQGFLGSTDGIDNFGLEFTTTDGSYQLKSQSGSFVYSESGGNNASGPAVLTTSDEPVVVCFASGTAILTDRGNVAVEDLVVGDLAETASGGMRPIRWLGQRTIEKPSLEQQPVRISAGAFGDALPERDLFLSPGHPVLVGADEDGDGGHLVPVMCLINGTTVARVPVDTITYWHVELDKHDILLAEGLPAESYLDWGDRAFFTEAADHAMANPNFVVPGLAGRCRPVLVDGPVVEAERRRLDALFATCLAAQCAWPSEGAGAIAF